MAHHKSAKKRIKTNEKKRLRNRSVRSRVRTYIRNFVEAAQAAQNDSANKSSHREDVRGKLTEAISELQRATSKGVYHQNTTSRKVGRLTNYFNKVFAE